MSRMISGIREDRSNVPSVACQLVQTNRAPVAAISSQLRSQSPANNATPRHASRSTVTRNPNFSASSTVNFTQ